MMGLKEVGDFKAQGDMGVDYASGYFTSQGYRVLSPKSDCLDFDFLARMGPKNYKGVQVRTTYHKNKYGVYIVHLSVRGGNRSGINTMKPLNKEEVDYLCVLADDGNLYLIPVEDIEATYQLNLGKKYDKYIVWNFCGKPVKHEKEVNKNTNKLTCNECDKPITKNSKSGLCPSCANKARRKIERPSIDLLSQQVKEHGYTGTGRMYGVSDNAIRKWLKAS